LGPNIVATVIARERSGHWIGRRDLHPHLDRVK
jgi:hypothetical protein